MKEIILILISYLYGSIPFALVIGKLFFNTDIRLSGSGNLGGTNAGRVLGKPVGLAVIILDASKAMIVVLLTSYLCSVLHINQDLKYICALACVIGHCWPIFAGFKGGKAVSTAIGYFFAVYPLWALAVLLVFLIILKIFKYVSLSSVLASLTVLLCTPFMSISLTGKIVNLFIVLILVYRHIPNLKRIKNHTEPKIKWM
ncbi:MULTISPECIES: glycerol-3-phosphate 1-O-acyltransferase PlsY [Coprobacillaceae]|uniref:glycerol-3-phosphate 1-O-acyltransferase PlsY n=1 Tax=Coprobacillaceae TaxID=2810280 RepID=UPI000E4B3922|nr:MULTISPECIES: glycerol-3-phosphate 1-O-acyltransferase PlsY [Coprobacillaceae]RHM63664.1 glycerol-3-phosphate 1-O-acyltransferase [Coprobacillus sp. AF33-1AC]RHS96393.1 glycerol-3-phosphate 1-O-acyltransferase [Erysipelatoclostridium sp. AM42-17]